jgi:hypothetical protein
MHVSRRTAIIMLSPTVIMMEATNTTNRRSLITKSMSGSKRQRSSTGPMAYQHDVGDAPSADSRVGTRPSGPGVHGDAYYKNLYSVQPDFKQLGRQDPEFKALYQPSALKIRSVESVRLTHNAGSGAVISTLIIRRQ